MHVIWRFLIHLFFFFCFPFGLFITRITSLIIFMIKFKVKPYLWSTVTYHFDLVVVLVSVGRLKLFVTKVGYLWTIYKQSSV